MTDVPMTEIVFTFALPEDVYEQISKEKQEEIKSETMKHFGKLIQREIVQLHKEEQSGTV